MKRKDSKSCVARSYDTRKNSFCDACTTRDMIFITGSQPLLISVVATESKDLDFQYQLKEPVLKICTKSKKNMWDVEFKLKISHLNSHAHYHPTYYTHIF